MITFQDLFKRSVLSNWSTDLTLGRILLTMGLALALGLFLYFVYKKTFRGVMYSRSYNHSLILITMVTALVIMAVTSNIVLSLGMVGALSIVRFRTAVKDPMDLVFLFWAIAVGIVTGAGLYILAIVGSLVIGLIVFVLSRTPVADAPYLLVVNCATEASDSLVQSTLKGQRKRFAVKSRTISPAGIETTYEVRVGNGGSDIVREIAAIEGVRNAVLVAYNGDYAA